jgi:hypothetical protein
MKFQLIFSFFEWTYFFFCLALSLIFPFKVHSLCQTHSTRSPLEAHSSYPAHSSYEKYDIAYIRTI